jgi:hypothetical protein
MKHFNVQLKDSLTGQRISASGGVCYVATAGLSAKIAIATSATGTAATSNNPKALTNGMIEFWTADSVASVDLYILAPGGQFAIAKTVAASGPNEIAIDTNARNQVMVIPFDITDTTATTETDTGFDEPASALMLPAPAVRMSTVDATETIDVGTLSTDSGDANGFMVTAPVSAALSKGTLADGAATIGALLCVDESSGDLVPEAHVSGGKSITYTLTAGTDTAIGFIVLPYQLTGA